MQLCRYPRIVHGALSLPSNISCWFFYWTAHAAVDVFIEEPLQMLLFWSNSLFSRCPVHWHNQNKSCDKTARAYCASYKYKVVRRFLAKASYDYLYKRASVLVAVFMEEPMFCSSCRFSSQITSFFIWPVLIVCMNPHNKPQLCCCPSKVLVVVAVAIVAA